MTSCIDTATSEQGKCRLKILIKINVYIGRCRRSYLSPAIGSGRGRLRPATFRVLALVKTSKSALMGPFDTAWWTYRRISRISLIAMSTRAVTIRVAGRHRTPLIAIATNRFFFLFVNKPRLFQFAVVLMSLQSYTWKRPSLNCDE